MKKKLVSLLLVLALACLSAACGGDKKNAGEWYLAGAELDGLLAEPEVLGIAASLSLNEDGTGRLTIDEDGYWIDSWSVKDGKVKIKMLEGTAEGTLSNGYIVLAFDDGISLWFAKEGSDVAPLVLLDAEGFVNAYAALVESGDAMPVD